MPIANTRESRNDNPQDFPELPHSIELEQTVLGTVLIDNRAYEAVADRVTSDHFFDPMHARLWEVISRMVTAGTLASPVTILPIVKDWPQIGPDLTVGQYLGRLAGAAMPPNRIRDYAKSLTDLATRRQMISVAQDVIARAMDTDSDDDADKIVEQAEQEMFAITQRRTEGREITIGQASTQAIEQISQAYERGGQIAGLQTRLTDLDAKLGGLQNSDLIILGGRPGSGKTSLATTIAANISRERATAEGEAIPGVHVHFFSQEMSGAQLAMRMISDRANMASDLLRRGQISPDQFRDLVETSRQVSASSMTIDETGGISLAALAAKARRTKRRKNTGLIVIDYLQLMSGSNKRGQNRTNEISDITMGLKALAKELDVPILALSQLSRNVEQRTDKRPQLADLRECLPGDARILNANTGARVPIREVVAKGLRFDVWALDQELKLVKRPIRDAWSVGVKQTVTVSTETGRRLRCTPEHKVFSQRGWLPLCEITDDDVIAMPRSYGDADRTREDICEDKAFLMGLLLGNGYLRGSATLSMPATDDPDLYAAPARRAFGIEATIAPEHSTDKANRIVFSTGRPCGAGKNPMTTWLRNMGVWLSGSATKAVPNQMMEMGPRETAALVRGLFQTDGSVVPKKTGGCYIKFTSISEQLARDLQHLLLKLGIISVLSSNGHGGGRLKSKHDRIWLVSIHANQQVKQFERVVGLLGGKGQKLRSLIKEKQNDASALDRLPLQINNIVTDQRRARGWSHAKLGWRDQGKRMSRETAAMLAERLCDSRLQDLSASDVTWERVTSVVPSAEEECFDVTVEGLHSFVVDDFVTHNSGSIEQDADVVMFVYRDEYYIEREKPGEDDPDKYIEWQTKLDRARGKAEVIIGKQRHGPIGIVEMAFEAQFTRFSNLAR